MKIEINKQEVQELISQIIWMARRYADGRRTYAPDSFNRAYDGLRDIFGAEIDTAFEDTTLTEGGKYFPYAFDHSVDVISRRKYRVEK